MNIVVMLMAAVAAVGPVDRVNTGIGSISHMLVPTYRTVQLPNAMYRFNGPAGAFTEDRVDGIRLFTRDHRGESRFMVRPVADGRALTWDQEHATPYSYDVYLDTAKTRFGIAPFEKGAIASFVFEGEGERTLVFACGGRTEGRRLSLKDHETFLEGEFDRDIAGTECGEGRTTVRFGRGAGEVRLRFAVSFISQEQAAKNLKSDPHAFDIEALKADARKRWNERLGVIEVEGGTEDERSVFYTALWRCFERMTDITEDGRYLGMDGKVHEAGGRRFYTDDWTWDTYRATHPLMTILCPEEEADKLESFVRMAKENPEGWMPVFPCVSGDRHCMVNRHTAVMFLDAWRKDIRGFDAKAAFEASDHTEETESLVPWYRGKLTELDRFYKRNGYYPALDPGEREWVQGVHTNWEKRQAVSVTLGASLDAWALAEFGREIGIDAKRLEKYDRRAKGYELLWNAKTGFFHPKNAKGEFIEPMDYTWCGGGGGRDYYTENNAWVYNWDVQHDLGRLVELMGGKAAVEARLDEMLNVWIGRRFEYVAAMPDGCTGLMGVYTMANEPAFHIPYLYNYAGRPDKTQKFVRKTLECWFRNDRMGMCGDEDGGGMSAYAVFSMLGFYPVTPGTPEYQWGSPVFTKAVIHLENGRDFTLVANGASKDAKYFDPPVPLKHSDILAGATVTLEMRNRP